jgi:hypothetical protein
MGRAVRQAVGGQALPFSITITSSDRPTVERSWLMKNCGNGAA